MEVVTRVTTATEVLKSSLGVEASLNAPLSSVINIVVELPPTDARVELAVTICVELNDAEYRRAAE